MLWAKPVILLEWRAWRAASNPLRVCHTRVAPTEKLSQILRIVLAIPQVQAIDSGLVDRFAMCGVFTDRSRVRTHHSVHERVWCKYSNELYDIVIKQYYG
jgi:hypothetical protein